MQALFKLSTVVRSPLRSSCCRMWHAIPRVTFPFSDIEQVAAERIQGHITFCKDLQCYWNQTEHKLLQVKFQNRQPGAATQQAPAWPSLNDG